MPLDWGPNAWLGWQGQWPGSRDPFGLWGRRPPRSQPLTPFVTTLLRGFEEMEPQSIFGGAMLGAGLPGQQQRYFMENLGREYQRAMAMFQSQLASQAMAGYTPQQTFLDFAQNIPFTQRYASIAPQERLGVPMRRFAPSLSYRPF